MRMMRPVAVIRLSAALGEIPMSQRKEAMPGSMVWFRHATPTRRR